ncbi:tetratricopeptide repeat protein [Streptomyces sp. DSM 44915]|uniref:Tetratricopeptide repeat protein n=1 Tax=Streptomyces chisholmiae TaxID=3075540 RepID=A0ABU2K2H0_9ACTN|nr:tetratricopeptide repeat protein [Streptomyces sp. DSM 44915]MDT0270713.1 tetratricopeptide repeat protein [Streptomyces sp. DSM 44915]
MRWRRFRRRPCPSEGRLITRPEDPAPAPGGTRSGLSGAARDVVQAGSVRGGVHFHAPGPAAAGGDSGPVPRQLPSGIRGFVNRVPELAQLDEILAGDGESSFDVPVCLITGTAGGGKTSLALRWAHQVRERFPDGQLHINLRGYDPGEPVTAGEALHRFLSALGVRPEQVPAEPDAAAALYRSLLAGRRMLILLDNAATIAQVRPLLPGTAGCLTLITSRSRLPGLAIRDGARRITLGTLPAPEAVALLRAVTAEERPRDTDAELAELARLCAYLPLALRIAAERAASRPHLSLAELIAELRDESALWDALSTGDDEEAEAVRTVFAWSYRALPPAAARLFRLLGLHPTPQFALSAAGALAGLSPARARQLLDVLVGAHLLEQCAPDRYEFHDLLRAYAMDQARRAEPVAEREAAERRLVEWSLRRADAAARWISPTERRLVPEAESAEVLFEHYDAAVDFAEREFPNLLATVQLAARLGWHERGWRLAAVLWAAQPPSSATVEWLAAGRTGLELARAAGDRAGEARLLTDLGMAAVRLNDLAEGARCHQSALELWQGLADRAGVAGSLNLLGLVHLRRRELTRAGERFERARETFLELGDAHRAATALANLASVRLRAGELARAAEAAELALEEHRALSDPRGAGNALRLVSEVRRERGETGPALEAARRAVEIALELRSRPLEGYWLLTLGAAQLAAGQPAEALVSCQRSASLHRRLGDRGREALAWQGSGAAYQALGRPAEAADFHRRAVAAHRELADDWHTVLALEALGTALSEAEALGEVEALDEADADGSGGERADGGGAGRAHWAAALRLLGAPGDPRGAALRARLAGRLAGSAR